MTQLALEYFKQYNSGSAVLYIDRNIYDILKPHHYGGRCGVIPGMYTNITYIDFKSMYTTTLLEEFPRGLPHLNEFPVSEINIKNISKIAPGFYYVEVLSEMIMPILPQRSAGGVEYKNGLFFGLY